MAIYIQIEIFREVCSFKVHGTKYLNTTNKYVLYPAAFQGMAQ